MTTATTLRAERKPNRTQFQVLWAYIRPYGWVFAVSLLLVAIVGVLEAVTPISDWFDFRHAPAGLRDADGGHSVD